MRVTRWTIAAVLVVGLMGWLPNGRAQEVGRRGPAVREQQEGMKARSVGRRVGCDEVVSRVDREKRAGHGRAADMSSLAQRLGTTVFWVEHCMLTYGRRPKRPGVESAEIREERMESLEENEPEETAAEDVPEPGAAERPFHPARERRLKLQPPPTPK